MDLVRGCGSLRLMGWDNLQIMGCRVVHCICDVIIATNQTTNIVMKNLLTTVMCALLLLGCSDKYDDTELRKDLADLENRVAKLEQLCQQMNTNIESLKSIVTSLQNNDYVTGIAPVILEGKEIGYTITFAKGTSITIYHGKDGADGDDGYAPIIGVRKDADGSYYWTLDGDWLTDSGGNKIKADGSAGRDGTTPQLRITDGYWEVSYDNGSTWSITGKATGEDGAAGDSFFRDVSYDDDNVYFELADGTVIIVPRTEYEDFIGNINSISYIPQTWDSRAPVHGMSNGAISRLRLSFGVSPANVVSTLESMWEKCIAVDAVLSESGEIVEMPVTYFSADKDNGIIRLEVSGENLPEAFFENGDSASAVLKIYDSKSDYSSDYIPVYGVLGAPSDEIWYTSVDKSLVSSIYGYNWEESVVSNTYVGGYGVIKFDGDVKSLPDFAFDANPMLKNMLLPECISEIGIYAFSNCLNLETVNIPQVNEIKDRTFYMCSKLKRLVIPDGVTKIGEWTFHTCESMSDIVIPKSVVSIGHSSFANCDSLACFSGDCDYISDDRRSLIVADTLLAAATCGLDSFVIPDGITYLAQGVFSRLECLTEMTIPEGVERIGPYAFDRCPNLKSITLPTTVTYMGEYVFQETPLKTLYCKAVTPPFVSYNEISLSFVEDAKIYVPTESVGLYKENPVWGVFSNIIYGYEF